MNPSGNELGGNPTGEGASLLTRSRIQDQYRIRNPAWFDWLSERIPIDLFKCILDVGCGPALFWQKVNPSMLVNRRVFLGDPSAQMLKYARSQLSTQYASDFMLLSGSALPFSVEFDLLLALGVLDLVEDARQVLGQFARVLKPKGYLYLSVGAEGHLYELEELASGLSPSQDIGGKPECFGLENAPRLVSPLFHALDIQEYRNTLVFHQEAPVWQYMISEASLRKALSSQKEAALRHRIAERLQEKGEIRVTIRKGLVVAQKAA